MPTQSAMQHTPEPQKPFLVKYLHNWLRDGEQINKFVVQPAPNDTLLPDTQVHCPIGCGEFEAHDHFFYCKHPIMKMAKVYFFQRW